MLLPLRLPSMTPQRRLLKPLLQDLSCLLWLPNPLSQSIFPHLPSKAFNSLVKRYARTAQRYIDAYHHKRLSFAQVAKAVKKFSSHRRIGVDGF